MISWFITDLRLGWLIILVITIWLASSIIDDTNSDNKHPWTFIIVTVVSVLSIMVITNIDYRRSTTFHYHALGFDGNSQPSDYDGDIRITISRSNNATNSLFGD